MVSHWQSSTRKLNRHYQSYRNVPVPPTESLYTSNVITDFFRNSGNINITIQNMIKETILRRDIYRGNIDYYFATKEPNTTQSVNKPKFFNDGSYTYDYWDYVTQGVNLQIPLRLYGNVVKIRDRFFDTGDIVYDIRANIESVLDSMPSYGSSLSTTCDSTPDEKSLFSGYSIKKEVFSKSPDLDLTSDVGGGRKQLISGDLYTSEWFDFNCRLSVGDTDIGIVLFGGVNFCAPYYNIPNTTKNILKASFINPSAPSGSTAVSRSKDNPEIIKQFNYIPTLPQPGTALLNPIVTYGDTYAIPVRLIQVYWNASSRVSVGVGFEGYVSFFENRRII